MTTIDGSGPFHEGERQAQLRAGAGDVSQWASGFIRDHLPMQHREFHMSLPFLVVAGCDAEGRLWVSAIEGQDGFMTSPDPGILTLQTRIPQQDPLCGRFEEGGEIGALGIDLGSRRRNRFSGRLRRTGESYCVEVRQSFGNCPQYIHSRNWYRDSRQTPGISHLSHRLDRGQIGRIRAADTLFVGSGQMRAANAAARGFDASHRGGEPGFVRVVDDRHLQIPDYPGNNYFNTIGNLVSDSRIALLFMDFATGGLLHLSGRASIDWAPLDPHDMSAQRMIHVEIDSVLDRPEALSLRWSGRDRGGRRLRLARRRYEAEDIASFWFEAADGRPLPSYSAGQYLPLEVTLPDRDAVVRRNYSLSGDPADRRYYRLGIKREAAGLVSRFLHDELHEGAEITAHDPAGEFVLPCASCPLVLVSAGVGQTPLLAMLHAAAANRMIWYVHGVRNGLGHAFRAEVAAAAIGRKELTCRFFYSQPRKQDIAVRDYDVMGRISAGDLLELGAGPDAHYMLCGPVGFLSDLSNGLERGGVPVNQIHSEIFGPVQSRRLPGG